MSQSPVQETANSLDQHGRLEGTQAEIVSLDAVSFGYSRKRLVLQDLNLNIQQGEFLTLLGPSGCGKSTILNLIA